MLLNPYRFGGPPSPLLTGLISYWKLDEASGNAIDSHGSNTLTSVNSVGSAAGKIGNARDFEKDSSQYFTIPSNASLQTGDIEFTFTAWVKFESLVGYPTIIGKDNDSSGREYSIYHHQSLNRIIAQLFPGGAGMYVAANALGAPSAGVWYFVAVWHDPAANKLYIQVNNGGIDEAAVSGGTAVTTTAFRIGAFDNAGDLRSFDGLIDEPGFWKRLLLPAERTSLYNSGFGKTYPFDAPDYVAPPPSPHLYWRINSIVIPGGGYLQISEIRVFSGVTDVTATPTKTASHAVAGGAFTNLFDNNLSNEVVWTEAVAEGAGFYIQFVFATPTLIDGVKQGGFDTATRYMAEFTLQWSDDGSAWTTLGTKSGLLYPGNFTLSALYAFT